MHRAGTVFVLAFTIGVTAARAQGVTPDTTRTPRFHAAPPFAPLIAPSNPALRPGGRLAPYLPPALVAAAWEDSLRRSLPDLRRLLPPAPPAELAGAPPPSLGPQTFQSTGASGFLGQYAQIGLTLNLRMELRADQFRNLNCTAFERQQVLSGCTAKFPTITPTPQYAIRGGGVVGQRLHLNLDFDSQREFDANNQIQVWYEGLEDEILKRVEVGNVTFQAPPSRFISAAIPANNFGVQAIAQLGPMEFRGIYAQQKGTVAKDRIYDVGQVTSQPIARDGRDLDYEAGRFFFAVDPTTIPNYPRVDILNLSQLALPPDSRVGSLHVYRVRAVAPGSATNQDLGGVRAVACGPGPTRPVDCSLERAGPFQWELLQEGRDYYVDPSGAWFALAARLDVTDYLAVSYVPLSGQDTVGTFPVLGQSDTTRVDTLRLVYDPSPGVTAASPAFRFEIRNAYRFGGSDLTRETAQLSLTVNQRQRPVSAGQTYLQLLGLALPTDPTQFDQYNRLFPRTRDPSGGAPLRDYYVIFPTLFPFADSTKLTPAERNDSLYRTPRDFLVSQAPPSVFGLHFAASVVASADRSELSLNSIQIREGSEKLYVGGTLLTRGVDYTIDYPSGQVTFLHPDSLFANGQTQVRAQFEEQSTFAVAPTSIYGLAAKYDLGTTGDVNFTGLFQNQQSAFTRPPLGSEPASSFIGGMTTELHFQPMGISRLFSGLPGVGGDVPSFLNVNTEIAMSKPSPNKAGQAYLEEFETDAGRPISLSDVDWRWGSIPTSTRGATGLGIGAAFDTANAAALTWQSLPLNADGSVIQFFPQQIDPQIVLAGAAQAAEPVLWVTMKPDTMLGLADSRTGLPNWVRPPVAGPRWRSITTVLSSTGIDLSRVEYLELWVWEDNRRTAKANHTTLLLDFGSVYEDALAFVPDSFTTDASGDTTYYGRRAVGRGRLDSERDPLTHSWNAVLNDEGILSDRVTDGIENATTGQIIDTLPLCDASVNGTLALRFFGDPRSRCGRHNGAIDTEDQDGDFQLDSVVGVKREEDFVRFVFPIGDDKYYVRDGGMVPVSPAQGGGAAGWRLYRIPFRTDTMMIGEPNLRQIQSLRITIVAPETAPPGAPEPQVFFGLARVRLVGSTWLKRADTPIHGVAGATGSAAGQVIASEVSTENRDLGYTPPPGDLNQASRTDAGFQLNASQINERSLRLLASGLGVGDRAEVFERFTTEGDKNFLKYRTLRVWARGRGPGWEDGDLQFYIKVGKDENNFYMYRTAARTASWEPEVVVPLAPWLELRARVEAAWLAGDAPHVYPGCPDSTLVPPDSSYVMCDGPYLIHVHDPATGPPNLAAVQEMAAGIFRVADRVAIPQAEVWVDDIRLSDVVNSAGMAGAVDVNLTASNVAELAFSLSHRDADFRQLGEDPNYLAADALSVSGTLHLERFLPASWGLALPVQFQYSGNTTSPFYLDGTDIRADALANLRSVFGRTTSIALALRRVRRSEAALGRWFLDPTSVTVNYTTGTSQSSLSTATASNYSVTLAYSLVPGPATTRAVPGFLAGLVHHLPGFLRRSAFFSGLADARLRWNPTAIRFASALSGTDARQTIYQVPIREAGDALIAPARAFTHVWRNTGGLDLAPFTGLQVHVDAASLRDLRDYGDSTTMGRLVGRRRATLFGANVGFEAQRAINTFVAFTPNLAAWLRPRVAFSTGFNLTRDPNASEAVRTIGDTAGGFRLPTSFANSQRLDASSQFDFRRLGAGLAGDSAFITRLLARVTGVTLTYSRTRQSTFAQSPVDPSFRYQIGWGGIGSFQRQDSVLAVSAAQNATVTSTGNLELPLGVRANATYQRTTGVTWVLRTVGQAPISVSSLSWPAWGATWGWSPPGAVGRVLIGITASFNDRTTRGASAQPPFAGTGLVSVSTTVDRTVSPSLAFSWIGGVLTSLDASRDVESSAQAGSVFRSTRDTRNAYVSWAFRLPKRIVHLPSPIRATARYSTIDGSTCVVSAGQAACIPYIDSRQQQTQFSMDTSFPPTLSAGLQVAYLVDDERQFARKTAQLVITAFVSLSTSVGQLR